MLAQFEFDVVTTAFNAVSVQFNENAGFVDGTAVVTNTPSGFHVRMIALQGTQTEKFFTGTNPITLFTLTFTPTQLGNIRLNFDLGKSFSASDINSNDQLLIHPETVYTVKPAPTPTPVPATPKPTPTPTPATPKPTATPAPTATPTPPPATPRPTPIPTATPAPGVDDLYLA